MGTPRPKETPFFTGVIPQLREGHPVQIQNQLPRLQAVVTQNETSAPIAATKSLLLDERMVTEQELAARAPHPLLNPKALLWVPSL